MNAAIAARRAEVDEHKLGNQFDTDGDPTLHPGEASAEADDTLVCALFAYALAGFNRSMDNAGGCRL